MLFNRFRFGAFRAITPAFLQGVEDSIDLALEVVEPAICRARGVGAGHTRSRLRDRLRRTSGIVLLALSTVQKCLLPLASDLRARAQVVDGPVPVASCLLLAGTLYQVPHPRGISVQLIGIQPPVVDFCRRRYGEPLSLRRTRCLGEHKEPRRS